jgi:hypothetical protein
MAISTSTPLKTQSDAEVCKSLRQLDSIGVWTAGMPMLFSLFRPDIVRFGDLAILRGMRMLYHHRKITRALLEKYRRRYSPHGSVASLYHWATAGNAIDGMRDYAPGTAKTLKRRRLPSPLPSPPTFREEGTPAGAGGGSAARCQGFQSYRLRRASARALRRMERRPLRPSRPPFAKGASPSLQQVGERTADVRASSGKVFPPLLIVPVRMRVLDEQGCTV